MSKERRQGDIVGGSYWLYILPKRVWPGREGGISYYSRMLKGSQPVQQPWMPGRSPPWIKAAEGDAGKSNACTTNHLLAIARCPT